MEVAVHELSIAGSIAETVRRHAQGRPVERVRVELGALRQIVPDTLAHCWGLVVEGGDLAGAELEITQVPAAITCRECGVAQVLVDPIFVCEACGSASVSISSGEEFMITSYDLAAR